MPLYRFGSVEQIEDPVAALEFEAREREVVAGICFRESPGSHELRHSPLEYRKRFVETARLHETKAFIVQNAPLRPSSAGGVLTVSGVTVAVSVRVNVETVSDTVDTTVRMRVTVRSRGSVSSFDTNAAALSPAEDERCEGERQK